MPQYAPVLSAEMAAQSVGSAFWAPGQVPAQMVPQAAPVYLVQTPGGLVQLQASAAGGQLVQQQQQVLRPVRMMAMPQQPQLMIPSQQPAQPMFLVPATLAGFPQAAEFPVLSQAPPGAFLMPTRPLADDGMGPSAKRARLARGLDSAADVTTVEAGDYEVRGGRCWVARVLTRGHVGLTGFLGRCRSPRPARTAAPGGRANGSQCAARAVRPRSAATRATLAPSRRSSPRWEPASVRPPLPTC